METANISLHAHLALINVRIDCLEQYGYTYWESDFCQKVIDYINLGLTTGSIANWLAIDVIQTFFSKEDCPLYFHNIQF